MRTAVVSGRIALLLALGPFLATCDDKATVLGDALAFSNEMAEAICSVFVRCGALPNREICLAKWRVDSREAQEGPTLAAKTAKGRVIYRSDIAQQCLALIRGASCRRAMLDEQALETACDDVFEGKVPDGQPCEIDEECAGQGSCIVTAVDRRSGCPRGQCVGRTLNANACQGDHHCERGQTCIAGKCGPIPGPGEACSKPNCRQSVCDAEKFVCRAPTPTGGACRHSSECDEWLASLCAHDGTCRKLVGAGQPCVGFGDCSPHLRCVGGRCQPRKAEGEICTAEDDCLVGQCRHGDIYDPNGTEPKRCLVPVTPLCDGLPAL